MRYVSLFAFAIVSVLIIGCVREQQQQSAPLQAATTKAMPSSLGTRERQYLVWLLLERQEAGLPDVPIRHLNTIAGSCAECAVLTYAWGDEPTTARVEVNATGVVSAQDSDGYDYLMNE